MKDLVLKLEKKEWVLDYLGKKINGVLKNKICDESNIHSYPISNTFLTSSYYRNGINSQDFPKISLPKYTLIYNKSVHSNFFAVVLPELFKQGQVSDSDYTNDMILDWMQEFEANFCVSFGFNQITSFIEYIVLLENVTFQGASHPHFLGTLFIKNPQIGDKLKFYFSIVHESAHQELFLINFIDRLVNEKYDYNMIHAPYQNKLRPPIGRLHSLHALYRMLQFSNLNKVDSEYVPILRKKFLENLNAFSENELTEFSLNLIKNVYQEYKNEI